MKVARVVQLGHRRLATAAPRSNEAIPREVPRWVHSTKQATLMKREPISKTGAVGEIERTFAGVERSEPSRADEAHPVEPHSEHQLAPAIVQTIAARQLHS